MRLVRIAFAVGLVLAGVGMSGSPARAGGAVFDFPKDSYLPGDVVVGVSKNVSIRIPTTAKPQDGPFHAFLVRSGGRFDPFQRATGDSRRIPLGPISFTKTRPGFVTARIVFRVPDVEHGTYAIQMCNRPCTDRWVGDLVGGWFYVGTPLEYRVLTLRTDLADQRRRLHGQTHRLLTLRSEMRTEVAAVEQRLGGDLAEMHRLLRSVRSDGVSPTWLVLGWTMAGLLGIALVLLARRRRITADALPQLRDGRPHPDFERADR